MKLEVGKYYRSRDGQKVGPMRADITNWWDSMESVGGYNEDGSSYAGSDPDLISEWVETPPKTGTLRYESGPVITETVTTKRIVPGQYGVLDIGDTDDDMVQVQIAAPRKYRTYITATELTAAIEALTAIRDAMAHNSAK